MIDVLSGGFCHVVPTQSQVSVSQSSKYNQKSVSHANGTVLDVTSCSTVVLVQALLLAFLFSTCERGCGRKDYSLAMFAAKVMTSKDVNMFCMILARN